MEPRRVSPWRAMVALLALTAGCSLEYAPPSAREGQTTPDADTTVVLTELQACYRDFSARDWPAFSEHFWSGATITTIWRADGADSARVRVATVPEFVAAAPAGPGSRAIFEESMLGARITVNGEVAQAWVTYRARFGDPGAVREWRGIDAFTLVLHAGRWRIVSLAFDRTDGGP